MKICFRKQNANIYSNYNEPDLRILFPILEEIKEKQSKTLPKDKYDNLDTLFDIITHVSLLHNQIFHLTHTDLSKSQINHILQLNRFNLEKSINDFFNSSPTIDLGNNNHCSPTKKSNRTISPEQFVKKEKEIISTKLNKYNDNINGNDIDIKQYLCVNRTLRCNSQLNISKKDKEVSNSRLNTITTTSNNNKNDPKPSISSAKCPHSEKKAQCNPLTNSNKKMQSKVIYSQTLTYMNMNRSRKKYQKKPLSLKIEAQNKKSKLYLNCKSYQSFDKKKDNSEYRDIAKPSNYTRYLLRKYKDVVETYDDELRHSLNTSMKRPKSTNKRDGDTSKSFENSSAKIPDEKRRQNSSNCFIKITKMPPHH